MAEPHKAQRPVAPGRRVERGNHLSVHSSPADRDGQGELAAPSIDRVPSLLQHHAGFVERILVMICAAEPVSMAGRRALAFTVERIRQCAEVIRAPL